jgi:hypothetical protein
MISCCFACCLVASQTGAAGAELPIATPVPLAEFDKAVGACPYVDGPSNVRAAPHGAVTAELPDFARVQILELRRDWVRVKEIAGPCTTAAGIADASGKVGWTHEKNLRFVRAINESTYTVFGTKISVESMLQSLPTIWSLSRMTFPYLVYFPSWDMGAGFLCAVGKEKGFCLDGMKFGGRLGGLKFDGADLVFRSDALCAEQNFRVPLEHFFSQNAPPALLPVDGHPTFVSVGTVTLPPVARANKKVLLKKGQKFSLINLDTAVPRFEIEVLPSRDHAWLSLLRDDATTPAIDEVAPQNSEIEGALHRDCAG